jgi:hypothetical protein
MSPLVELNEIVMVGNTLFSLMVAEVAVKVIPHRPFFFGSMRLWNCTMAALAGLIQVVISLQDVSSKAKTSLDIA